ncbi:MAG: sortase [Candidatus Nomurabacteria bacterium]|nr:sortase [Candidatus Nomurabacteria bacterium]
MSAMEIFFRTKRFVAAKVCIAVAAVVLLGTVAFLIFSPAQAAVENTQIEAVSAAEQIAEPKSAPAETAVEPEVESTPSVRAAQAIYTPPAPAVEPGAPTYVNIGGIISSAVTPVGLDAGGAVAVPGSIVGWWNGSARIGEPGASFLDGHSAGVFRNLASVGVGASITVTMGDGAAVNYRVVERRIFDYDYNNPTAASNYDIMRQALASADGADRLNIMTCAGQPVGNTYSQRLVVFAVRV